MKLPVHEREKEANGHQERRGETPYKRNVFWRIIDYPTFKEELVPIEGDTIVGGPAIKVLSLPLVEILLKLSFFKSPKGVRLCDFRLPWTNGFKNPFREIYFKSINFDWWKEFLTGNRCVTSMMSLSSFSLTWGDLTKSLNGNSNGLSERWIN